MSSSNDKTQKEKELEAFRKRRKIGKRQKRKRKIRKIARVMFRVSLFVILAVFIGILGYKGLSKTLQKYQTQIDVSNQKVFDVEELQLVLNKEGTFIKFYIAQAGAEGEEQMVATELEINNVRFRNRKDHPTPYLRVVCEDDSQVCGLNEAKEIIFFILKEDITALEVN